MKHLDFTLSMVDNITRPLKQVQASVKGFADASQTAFGKIALGGAALFAVAQGIKGSLGPAAEFAAALNEASARGVSHSALQQLTAEALKFSMQYGRSAVEVVRASAEVRTAISTLSDRELPRVTRVSAVLAAGMKSTVSEAAAWIGQMADQFDQHARRTGKVKFAGQLAGKTAYMAQESGVSMQTMAGLMEGTKGAGVNHGIGMDEQFAVLGQLEKTLGSDAGGRYENYIKGAVQGAKTLGLSFTDATGRMLSMPDMLEKLQGRYGKTLEGNLQAQAELDNAFGSGAAVIKQLYGHVGLLKKQMSELGSNDGMKRAEEMARKMADPWERLMAIWTGIRVILGLTLLPVLTPVIDRISAVSEKFARWMQLFPHLARLIGYALLALLGFAAAGATVNLLLGTGTLLITGWIIILKSLSLVLTLVRHAAMLAGLAINFISVPVLLVIVTVAALVAAVCGLIRYWEQIKAAMAGTAAFRWLSAEVTATGEIFSAVWQNIAAGWAGLMSVFTGLSPLAGLSRMADDIGNLFSGLLHWLKSSFAGAVDWITDKLNSLPGITIEATGISAPATGPDPAGRLLTGGRMPPVERGGINQAISNRSQAVTDNRKTVGTVNIYPQNGITPEQLMEWQELL